MIGLVHSQAPRLPRGMAINAVAMIAARTILSRTGVTPLRVLGAVFGILQLALGIQLMFWGIANGIAAV